MRIIVEKKETSSFSLVQRDDDKVHISSQTKYAVLNIVDLAGSEWLTNTELVSETTNINTSLFTLTHVIKKLSQGSIHIPYWDSKLTYILKSSLGGNSLSSFIFTMSPILEHEELTKSTLKFS